MNESSLEENQPYLVEVWQNLNGEKLAWHEVMIWDREEWCLHSDPCKKLASNQVAYKWVKISDITGWIKAV